MTWFDEQKEQWSQLYCLYTADTVAVATHEAINHQRAKVQQEMSSALRDFLEGSLTIREFNATFQTKTHGSWNTFRLKGMSGGMFLNKLVKYIPDDRGLERQFRMALRVPKDTHEARAHMHNFICFLENLIATRLATKKQLQPARAAFLLSAWWHIQNSEQWPIFFPIVQAVFRDHEEAIVSAQQRMDDYFTFRTCFLALSQVLGLSSWKLEHFLTWYGQRHSEKAPERTAPPANTSFLSGDHSSHASPLPISLFSPQAAYASSQKGESMGENKETSSYTHLLWLLAKIGRKVGCHVWIPKIDHHRIWNHELLSSLSLPTAPPQNNQALQRLLGQTQIVWFQDDSIVAVYAIEQTANVSFQLLRLYDLGLLSPPAQEPYLCVVVPKEYIEEVNIDLSRPVFQRHDLHRGCIVISTETLLLHEEHILRWACSPTIVEQLASHSNFQSTASIKKHA